MQGNWPLEITTISKKCVFINVILLANLSSFLLVILCPLSILITRHLSTVSNSSPLRPFPVGDSISHENKEKKAKSTFTPAHCRISEVLISLIISQKKECMLLIYTLLPILWLHKCIHINVWLACKVLDGVVLSVLKLSIFFPSDLDTFWASLHNLSRMLMGYALLVKKLFCYLQL